ncbi:Mur ligase family protein [Patescibacteria group bacterium]
MIRSFKNLFPQKLKNLKHFLVAVLAYFAHGRPSKNLYVIGVTGTDGKTTTVELIYHLLSSAGHKVAKVSTLGAKIGQKEIPIGFHTTTPSSWAIQRLMKEAVNQGVKFFILEATSIGLDQFRLLKCNFRVAVITNISKEHLDYHRSYDKYLKAKSSLFKNARYAVLNYDDESFRPLTKVIKEAMTSTLSYGLKKGAYLTPKSFYFQTKLIGEFNQYNVLAAVAVAKIFEVKNTIIRKALLLFESPRGRLEEIKAGQKFKVFVDFAHTPAAIKQALLTVKKLTKGKVIHVFGCTGDRDKNKRPKMGNVSGKLADMIFLTHEDTYRENPLKIIESIEPGVKNSGKILGQNYWKEPDRKLAIKKAINKAGQDDTVLITGVGHQVSLNIGGKEVPWSDQEIAQKAIKARQS